MRAYEILLEKTNGGMFVGINLSPNSVTSLAEWQKENNIPNSQIAEDMHVTLLYSKNKVFPWKTETLNLELNPNTYKLERFDKDVLVLSFDSKELTNKHLEGRSEHNIPWDFDSYKPHITLAKDLPQDFDISKLKTPTFAITLTDEYTEEFDSNLKEYTLSDVIKTNSANSGAYISPHGEVFELDSYFAHMDTLRASPYGKEFEAEIAAKYGSAAAKDPTNESVWHDVAQNKGWIKATWTVYRDRSKVVMSIEFRQPTKAAIHALIKWVGQYKDEFDLFHVNGASAHDFHSFVKLIRKEAQITETSGVGTIQKHNTTVDVKPGEIQRQAKKWGWDIDKNGNPPLISTIHKKKKKK